MRAGRAVAAVTAGLAVTAWGVHLATSSSVALGPAVSAPATAASPADGALEVPTPPPPSSPASEPSSTSVPTTEPTATRDPGPSSSAPAPTSTPAPAPTTLVGHWSIDTARIDGTTYTASQYRENGRSMTMDVGGDGSVAMTFGKPWQQLSAVTGTWTTGSPATMAFDWTPRITAVATLDGDRLTLLGDEGTYLVWTRA